MKDDFEYAYSIHGVDGVERKIFKSKSDPHKFKVDLGSGTKSWTEHLDKEFKAGNISKTNK